MKLKEVPFSFWQERKLASRSLNFLYENKLEFPVIVSFAVIPSRLTRAHLVIRSILSDAYIPRKILINIHSSQELRLPRSIKALLGEKVEVVFSDLKCPHRKLIDALEKYPDNVVVTCDDDMLYQQGWLKALWQAHEKEPNKIIANQSREIIRSLEGSLLPYKDWPVRYAGEFSSPKVLPIGAAGTLYPKRAFKDTVFDRSLFLRLAPTADDLWFKAMSLLNGTESMQLAEPAARALPILRSQKVSLKKLNVDQDKNRIQWQALTHHFDLGV